MYRPTILLVEDNQLLSDSISEYLSREGYDMRVEANGITAEQLILNEQPDLVILDLMLPGRDGVTICKNVRDQYKGIILMFTAKEDEIEQIIGLEIGADDYLIKPVKPRLLLAKVKAFLRRTISDKPVKSTILAFNNLHIDTVKRVVTLNQSVIDITAAEYDVLLLLAQNPGKILSRDYMLKNLKGFEYDGMERSTDNRISQLRKKLQDSAKSPQKIKTVRSKGYLFIADAW